MAININSGNGDTETYQIHTISCTRNKTHVAHGVQSAQFIECQALVHKVDWHELDSAKPAINTPNELVYSRSQILVFFNILA